MLFTLSQAVFSQPVLLYLGLYKKDIKYIAFAIDF